MYSGQADAAALLTSLESSQDFEGLYLRFCAFFRPFEDLIFFEEFDPIAVEKKSLRRKKPKGLPTKEKVRPLARQFHQFLCDALKLLPDLLRKSPCNGEEIEVLQEKRATELLGIYRLTNQCLLCISPCLMGQPFSVHLQWGQLVRRLESWDKYSDAEEEGFALLESLNTLLVDHASLLKSTMCFLPNPSVVGSAGACPQLACLVTEVAIVLTSCAFKRQSGDAVVFKKILALSEQLQPWLRIMEPMALAARHPILVDALFRCALFLAGQSKTFADDLVYSFCLKALKDCTVSPLMDRFPVMAHRICSAVDVKWKKRLLLIVDILKISMENNFCKNKVDLAKYVDSLLFFITTCADGFYTSSKNAQKDDLEMSLEVTIYLQQTSIALELCCKTICKQIILLCQPLQNKSKCIQDNDASKDLMKDVIRDAFTKCARVIDVLHKIGASKFREVIIKCMSELLVAEVSFGNLSLYYPLVKQWVKMLCKDHSDVNEVDGVPFLYSLLLCECPTIPKNLIGEILEQELLAYGQLESLNPALCHNMEIKLIDSLLKVVLNDRDFNLQRARVLVRKGLILRTRGIENLRSCFDCLSEAISLLENVTYDSSEANILGCHQLASAYLLRSQFAQETKQDWELIHCDVQCAINLLSELDVVAYNNLSVLFKPSAESTISLLCHTLDLLSLKGFLKFHFDLHALVNTFCKFENFSVEKYLVMLWTGRRLGHSLCTSRIDSDLVLRISQLPDNNLNSITFWTKCLKSSSYSLLMFIQNFFLSGSVLNDENVQQIDGLCSCKLTVEDVEMAVSSLLLDVSTKTEMSFIAGQIYFDLAERLFAGGRVLEALSYAKEALSLRYKVLRKNFIISSKKPAELAESSTATKGELNHLSLELLGSAITKAWRDITNLERCILSPWSILNCYLESILQIGVLHEATGDGVQAEKLFLTGQRFSILQSLPNFQIAFNCALGQLYCKKLLWDLAEDEIKVAKKLLQENDSMISCEHCKLIFEVTIDMRNGDLSMKRLNKGSHYQSHTLDIYRSAVRKLSNDMVEGSFISSLKRESIGESCSRCYVENTKNCGINTNTKLRVMESDRTSLACHICSFLKLSYDAKSVEKPSSARAIVLPHGAEYGESPIQTSVKKSSRNGSKYLLNPAKHNTEFKPRRSSRIQSFHKKEANLFVHNENCNSFPSSLDADTFIQRKSQIIENGTCSFDFECSDGGGSPRIECLKCLYLSIIKEGTMENIIYFKWHCQRRRLVIRLLLKMAKSLEASGEMQKVHEVHGVFWQCLSVLFDGKPSFHSKCRSYDINLFKLMGDNNIGDIFSVERAALLYNMSWFCLKNLHPEHNSAKCCSLSNVQMQDIISWLLRAFILCRQIPTFFEKVSRLLASLILLTKLDGPIPPPLCLKKSLSLSHWAAFFHQASIGSAVNCQYLSFVKEKACSFKGHKGLEIKNMLETDTKVNYISRYTPEKLENLGDFVENFFLGLPRASIICISLIHGDYANLLGEVLILPSFFPAWILITRLDGGKQPIVMFLPVDSISEGSQTNTNSCKEFTHSNSCNDLTRESEFSESDWPCPWSSAVIDEVAPSYRLILKENFSSLSNHTLDEAQARLNYREWWSRRMCLENQLRSFLKTMEDEWIGPWGCLLLGERLNVESLETFTDRICNHLNSECDFVVNDNVIKVILSGAQSLIAAETCIDQLLLYKETFGRGGCCGERRFRAFAGHGNGVKCMPTSIHSLISKAVGEGMTVDRQPVILILDTDVQMLPWENLPILKNQEVYRMPSVLSILLNLHHNCREKKNTFEVGFPCIDPFLAYYLLNPSGDLNHTQQQFQEWFQNQKWEGKAGNVPTTEELLLALQNHDLYLYFGHGSGMQYIRPDSFGKLHRCAAAFLMGCSSGSLRQRGSYAPLGAPLYYLFAGSPSVIANLWEVSDKDIDRFALAMLNSWTKDSFLLNGTCNKLRITSAISKGREACKLSTLIGASIVCYGVPTFLNRRI